MLLLYLDDCVQRIIQFRKKIVVFFAATYKSLCFASFAYCVSLCFFVYREAFMFAFTCSSCKLSDKDRLTHSRLAALYMRLPLIDPLQLFQGINVTYSLVGPDVLYPGEAKRKPAVVSIAFLYTIKCHLKYNLGPDD